MVITDRGNGPGVWIVNRNSSFSFRPVKIVLLGEEKKYIDDGIRPGR
jgi:hypothetical protein